MVTRTRVVDPVSRRVAHACCWASVPGAVIEWGAYGMTEALDLLEVAWPSGLDTAAPGIVLTSIVATLLGLPVALTSLALLRRLANRSDWIGAAVSILAVLSVVPGLMFFLQFLS